MSVLKRRSSNKNNVIAATSDNEEEIVPRTKKSKQVSFDCDSDDDLSIFQNDFSQIPKRNLPDQPEVGIVEKISVTNFMCHRRLAVSLGANVNFIGGRNGSGKSAILTGLIVGLGGNANNTARGNSLKGFVKEGCSAASISITLRNRGSDAYKPEVYGDVIVIDRRLTSTGSSSYKIKSADNQVISTRKNELMDILDTFNIQIDNPVSILTQDTARSFLNMSDEKDKYKLFLKATQLEQLSHDYRIAIGEWERASKVLTSKEEVLSEVNEQVKVHEEKYKDMQQLQKKKVQVQELKRDLAWAIVAEKKLEVEKAKAKEKEKEKEISDYEKQLNETIAHEEGIQNLYEEKGEEIDVCSNAAHLLFNEKTELHLAYKRTRKNASQIHEQCKRHQRDIHFLEKDRACLISRIDEIKDTVGRDWELENQDRKSQIEEKKLLLQTYESQLLSSNQHLEQIDIVIKSKQEQKHRLQNEMRDTQRQIDAIRKRIVTLQSSRNDGLSQFGKSTTAILKGIELAHTQKFHRKPIGPLGSYIKLKDYKWAKAVEQSIKGSTICAYLCNDNHDMLILKGIFKKCAGSKEPSIIVSRFGDHLYNTTHNRPTGFSPVTTVLDVLTIDNHLVVNALIDQCSIETLLLFENAKDAQEVMWNIKPPHGANMAMSKEGHIIIGGRSSKYYPCKNTDIQYLQKDVLASLKTAERELMKVQSNKEGIKQQIETVDMEVRQHKSEYNETKKKCSEEQDRLNLALIEINELQSLPEEILPDVFTLESELDECGNKVGQLNADLTQLNTCHEEKLREVEEAGNVMKDCDERCQVAGERLESLKDEVTALEGKLSKLKGHTIHYKQKLEEIHKILDKANTAYKNILSEYEETCSQASQYCEERHTSRTVKSLESEILKAQKRIDNEEIKKGNMEEISEKYQCVLKHYDKARKEIDNCFKYREAVLDALVSRAERYKKFQKYIAGRAYEHFNMLLSQRGYTGTLRFDHGNEMLTVQVNVEKAPGMSTEDSKALSGGERSFSTVCFIMALWEAMETPFRCLDEFDVFMDMLNRRISLNMIIDIAAQQKTRQFILLTPQDMSSIKISDRVHIFRLMNPEQG